jgi:hypothetical protein
MSHEVLASLTGTTTDRTRCLAHVDQLATRATAVNAVPAEVIVTPGPIATLAWIVMP